MESMVKLTKRALLDYGSADLKKLKLINSAFQGGAEEAEDSGL